MGGPQPDEGDGPARKKRVLIVDDEADFTFMLSLTLRRACGYETREENRGARALSAAREFRPDVILLDVVMPDLDGGAVAARLSADPATRDIPILFISALARPEEVMDGAAAGPRRFLPKPFRLAELCRIIDETLPGGGSGPNTKKR